MCVSLKDSKYKPSEQHLKNVPILGDRQFLCHKSLTHWSAELPRKVNIEWWSE